MSAPSEVTVLDALSAVIDPEFGLDIVTLGRGYRIEDTPEKSRIVYTLPSPGCSLGDQIAHAIIAEVSPLCPDRPVLVFSPPWDPERITEDAGFALGL